MTASLPRDVVVVGSANIDLTVRVSRLPLLGETLAGSELEVAPGGKGANQAVAAARLGATVSMVGRVGADAHGEAIRRALEQESIDGSRFHRDHTAATGMAFIMVTRGGDNSIVVSPGANARVSEEDIGPASWVLSPHCVVSVVLEIPADAVIAAARYAESVDRRFMLNLSPVKALPAEVLATADPLIVNELEARQLIQDSDRLTTDSELAAAVLAQLNPRSVVVTLGARGAVVVEGAAAPATIAPVATRPVDTTGAGDAFAGALAWRLSQCDTLADAAEVASRVAAHSVQRYGTQSSYPSASDLEA